MMDYIKYINIFSVIVSIICIVIIVVIKMYGKNFIGWAGEHWTKKALKELPKSKYIILNDICIMVSGIYHQIDHIVVSAYGIFVIETKQYNGFITGEEYDKYWIRHVGKKKYYYLNPIRQNYGHIKGLAELLHMSESKIHNIVCIPSRAELRIKHKGELVRNYNVASKILDYQDIVIENVTDIVNIINRYNITDSKTRKMYIGLIKNKNADKNSSKCPKCGGDLIRRNGKYGSFYGCSNYPKCKYIRK